MRRRKETKIKNVPAFVFASISKDDVGIKKIGKNEEKREEQKRKWKGENEEVER